MNQDNTVVRGFGPGYVLLLAREAGLPLHHVHQALAKFYKCCRLSHRCGILMARVRAKQRGAGRFFGAGHNPGLDLTEWIHGQRAGG